MQEVEETVESIVSVVALETVNPELEAQLANQITALWLAHAKSKTTVKRTREELKTLRSELAEHLHRMKAILARTGSGGEWSAFLRIHNIPRATADRHVQRHEDSLNPSAKNRLSEAIANPTQQQVCEFFQKIMPRLTQVLTTKEAVYHFALEMIMELPAANGMETDLGVVVLKPKSGAC